MKRWSTESFLNLKCGVPAYFPVESDLVLVWGSGKLEFGFQFLGERAVASSSAFLSS
jgi:hypothetical protein